MSNKESLYNWKSFPFIEFPLYSFLLILFLILVAVFVESITNNFYWIFFSLVILICSLFSYFVPTYYKFFDEYFVVTIIGIRRERKYTEFKCFYADKKGVMLSTFAKPRKIDRFRGQSIRFTKNQDEREKIMDFFEKKIGSRF